MLSTVMITLDLAIQWQSSWPDHDDDAAAIYGLHTNNAASNVALDADLIENAFARLELARPCHWCATT